jgi:hypothetical protein
MRHTNPAKDRYEWCSKSTAISDVCLIASIRAGSWDTCEIYVTEGEDARGSGGVGEEGGWRRCIGGVRCVISYRYGCGLHPCEIMCGLTDRSYLDTELSALILWLKGTTAWCLNFSFGLQGVGGLVLLTGERKRSCGFGRYDACAKERSSRPRGTFVTYPLVSETMP